MRFALAILMISVAIEPGSTQPTSFAPDWTVSFGGVRVERILGSAATPDGSIILTGHSQLQGDEESGQVLLVSLTESGSRHWLRSFDFGPQSEGTDVAVSGDAALVSVVSSESGQYGSFVSFHDLQTGDTLRTIAIRKGRNTTIQRIVVHPDGGFVIAGSRNVTHDQDYGAFLSRFGSDGQRIWTTDIGRNQYSAPRGLTLTGNAIYVAGATSDTLFDKPNPGEISAWAAKYDFDGRLLWGHVFGSEYNDMAYDVAVTPSGTVLVAGSSHARFDEPDIRTNRIIFVSTFDDGSGMMRDTRYYNPGKDFYLWRILAMDEGTFAFTGWTNGSFFQHDAHNGHKAAFGYVRNWKLVPESFQTIASTHSYSQTLAMRSDGSIIWSGFTFEGFFDDPRPGMAFNVFAKRLLPVPESGIMSDHSLPVWLSWLIPLGLGGVFFRLWKRRNPHQHKDDLELKPVAGGIGVWIGRRKVATIDGREGLLAHHLLTSAGTVVNDEIDRLLLPDHPSPDYVRKVRNQTVERLEARLQSIRPSTAPYVQKGTNPTDRRKTDYRLELEPVSPPVSASRSSATA